MRLFGFLVSKSDDHFCNRLASRSPIGLVYTSCRSSFVDHLNLTCCSEVLTAVLLLTRSFSEIRRRKCSTHKPAVICVSLMHREFGGWEVGTAGSFPSSLPSFRNPIPPSQPLRRHRLMRPYSTSTKEPNSIAKNGQERSTRWRIKKRGSSCPGVNEGRNSIKS